MYDKILSSWVTVAHKNKKKLTYFSDQMRFIPDLSDNAVTIWCFVARSSSTGRVRAVLVPGATGIDIDAVATSLSLATFYKSNRLQVYYMHIIQITQTIFQEI